MKDIVHISFEIGLFFNGTHGLTEITGGALCFSCAGYTG